MSPLQFEASVDTLDLLLFRSKNIGSKIQRSFTDHIALLLRYNSGEIVLFEVTGKVGVGLCTWKVFVKNKWHNLYEKLVYRQLKIERTDEIIDTTEEFIKVYTLIENQILNKAVLGNKYGVSPVKLLVKKASPNSIPNQDRSFFCSELVAAAYKKVGLLAKDIASSYYWPGSFSACKKLKLQGASLSNEYLIDFQM